MHVYNPKKTTFNVYIFKLQPIVHVKIYFYSIRLRFPIKPLGFHSYSFSAMKKHMACYKGTHFRQINLNTRKCWLHMFLYFVNLTLNNFIWTI